MNYEQLRQKVHDAPENRALRLVGRMTVESPPVTRPGAENPERGVVVVAISSDDTHFEIECRTSEGYWLVTDEGQYDRWLVREADRV